MTLLTTLPPTHPPPARKPTTPPSFPPSPRIPHPLQFSLEGVAKTLKPTACPQPPPPHLLYDLAVDLALLLDEIGVLHPGVQPGSSR